MVRYLLKDGRVVDENTVVDFDATHTNPVYKLTPDEFDKFVQSRCDEKPTAELADVSEDPTNPTKWVINPWTGQQRKDALYATAATARWDREQGGLLIGEIRVLTDDRSKLLLMGAKALADADPEYTTQWAVGGGKTVLLDAAAVQTLAAGVARFVDQCFQIYAEAIVAINAGEVTTQGEVKALFVK